MENLLKLVENLCPHFIDKEKLKYFTLKISISDNFLMLQTSYQSSSVGEKTALLKRYYSDLDAKYYGKEPGKFYSLWSEDYFTFSWRLITVFAACVLVIFCLSILLKI